MNNQNTNQNVLAIVASIAMIALISSIGAIEAVEQKMPYGSIAQEDENHAYNNGTLYLNVVFEKGNGQFMSIDAIVSETENLLNKGLM